MMEDLRFYDFNLKLLAIENKYISSNWTIYFNDVGKAEIHLPRNAKCLPLIFSQKYLIVTQGKKQAIVTGKQVGENCVIYARTPEWILTKKLVKSIEGGVYDVEDTVNAMTLEAFNDCENFISGERKGFDIQKEFEKTTPQVLSDFVKDSLSGVGGHRVYLDTKEKKWVFEVLKGEKKNVFISESTLTAFDTEYIFDLQDYFSHGIFETEDAEGVSFWQDTSKEENEGLFKWETILYSDNLCDAESELEKAKIKEEITAKVKNLKWGEDYKLGDTVCVKFERGGIKASFDMVVEGINLWSEAGDSGEQPILKCC